MNAPRESQVQLALDGTLPNAYSARSTSCADH
jgi:hypothetical protein